MISGENVGPYPPLDYENRSTLPHFNFRNPLHLLCFALLLIAPPTSAQLVETQRISYTKRPNRYNSLGWNQHHQYCYTDDEIQLMQKFDNEYQTLTDKSESENYFKLNEEKRLHDMWTCKSPAYSPATKGFTQDSFTLPSREVKDTQLYPFWNYSNRMARKIANWQSERCKNQDKELVNDPSMLALEELKNWYYKQLSERECRPEEAAHIAKRQSYVKNLIYLTPNFGPDRVYLHEIQRSLDEASNIVNQCLANKELPNLLSDAIVASRSLEDIALTYMHFLLVNEEVTDNFAPEYLQGDPEDCTSSPICKIYKGAIRNQIPYEKNMQLVPYQKMNLFYDLVKVTEEKDSLEFSLKLKEQLITPIKFATFVTPQQKREYLQTIATIESIKQIRIVFEKFQMLLPKIGTYSFAVHYIDEVEKLVINHANSVDKLQSLMKNIIQSADVGLKQMLSHQIDKQANQPFEKNLRALETKVAKGTTISLQLKKYCKNVIDSTNKYNLEMNKLVNSYHSGEASQELEKSMSDIFAQMHKLNDMLPGMLGGSAVNIKNNNNAVIPTKPHHASEDIIEISTDDASLESTVMPINNEHERHHESPKPELPFQAQKPELACDTCVFAGLALNNQMLLLGFIAASAAAFKFVKNRFSFFKKPEPESKPMLPLSQKQLSQIETYQKM